MVFEKDDGSITLYDWKRCKEIKKDNRFESAKPECIKHLPNSKY